ncbi:hypothetical protein AWENTII_005736 [Aspergillus wentii]|nr:hypothetical protein MW887_000357 [Aspergillus wentii]
MTDTSSVAITHSTTEQYPVTVPLNSPALNGAVSDSIAPDEEEPYTIKCICAFEDDDGNTVFCEGCETWQHIECYYHARGVPDVHNCVDCEPRSLDGRRATERQRRLREQGDGGDRKTKRSGAKTHKKKTREHGEQVNGFHNRTEPGARDQPPAKKAKTNHHRSSGSISSISGAPALPPDVRKRAATSMSPTKSLGPSIPLYSNEFMNLYERDQGHADMDSNLFVNLPLAADLASWVTEPSALARVTNGRSAQDIFTWTDTELDRSNWPVLSTESITDSTIDVDGKHPTWKILTTRDTVAKDEIVGEITGKIGLLRDYCLDPINRWQELRHPEPFVFFHPQLPLYVDSRHEGSMLRYVRRSCRPNVTMKTYITNEVEYHFCFVAKEDIPANSEITAMWYLDPQLFESTNGLVKQESSDNNTQDAAAICISNVLAHFGGCACDPPPTCLLSSVDRRRHPKSFDPGMKQANGKRKKTKSRPNITPPSTNSRAGSEVNKNPDDDDQADSRSASGSARGQTRSRDLTPTLANEHSGFGESELSAREKRKIAAAEKKFQQLELDQHASTHRKKKRPSGQATTPTVGSSAQAGYFTHQATSIKPLHLDTGSGNPSRSPPSAISPGPPRHGSPRKVSGSSTPPVRSPLGRARYVDSAIQTEPDADDAPPTSPLPSPRRPSFVPLTQRLLKRCHADRLKFEEKVSVSTPFKSDSVAMLSSPTSSTRRIRHPTPPSSSIDKGDVEMKDLDSPTPNVSVRQPQREMDLRDDTSTNPDLDAGSPRSVRDSSRPLLPPPWPSTAAHNARLPLNGHGINLLAPPTPTNKFAPLAAVSPGSGTASSMSPPSTVDHSSQLSVPAPGSGITAPSPVKKKLSLGDYLIRRGSKATPTSEKPQAQATAMLPPPKSPSAQSPANGESAAVDSSRTPTKPSGDAEPSKPESPSSPDVAMKDVPESTHSSHISSVTS